MRLRAGDPSSPTGVTRHVDSFDTTNGTGAIIYKNPGYSAELRFEVAAGDFQLDVEQGWVAVISDLHDGRDDGPGWRWTIDATAGFLVVIALSGLVMQLFLRASAAAPPSA